jgi:hypothetical protein
MRKSLRRILLIVITSAMMSLSMSASAFTWVGPVTILGSYNYDGGGALYLRTSGGHQTQMAARILSICQWT